MPVKTDWTNGDVLTANQVSAYLANAGLDFITEVFTGDSSVASIEVNDAFSDEYTHYKIMYQGLNPSGVTTVRFEFLDGNGDPVTGDSYCTAQLMDLGTTTITAEAYSYWYVTRGDSGFIHGQFDVFTPYSASNYSWMKGDAFAIQEYRKVSAFYYQQAGFTSFRFVGNAGTFTKGSISVYGYRLT